MPPPEYPLDPHSAEFSRDPWSVYRELRATCPVSHSPNHGGFWVLARHADVKRAALDPRLFSSAGGDLLVPAGYGGWLLPVCADPPLTGRYRHVLAHLFDGRAVKAMEPLIRQWATEAIDALAERGRGDLVRDLAHAIPGKVTMHLVGWPVEQWEQVVLPIKDFTTRVPGDPDRERAAIDVAGICRRIDSSIAVRRQDPTDDLASHLLASTVDSRPLSDEEMIALMMMVVFGGVDTTVAAIGNMLFHLDADRQLRRRLVHDPALLPRFVEELLRYEPPIQGFGRFLTAPTEIGGHEIDRGEKVFLLWGSANRDEEVFPDPDEVRIDRHPNPHLTFGAGVHHCLGAALARAELRITLEEMLRRLPDYEIERDSVVPGRTAGTVFERLAIPATF